MGTKNHFSGQISGLLATFEKIFGHFCGYKKSEKITKNGQKRAILGHFGPFLAHFIFCGYKNGQKPTFFLIYFAKEKNRYI